VVGWWVGRKMWTRGSVAEGCVIMVAMTTLDNPANAPREFNGTGRGMTARQPVSVNSAGTPRTRPNNRFCSVKGRRFRAPRRRRRREYYRQRSSLEGGPGQSVDSCWRRASLNVRKQTISPVWMKQQATHHYLFDCVLSPHHHRSRAATRWSPGYSGAPER